MRVKPGFWEEMMHFAGGAQTVCGRSKQVPKILIRKQGTCSKNDLGGTERECGRGSSFLRFESRHGCLRPIVARKGFGERIIERPHKTVCIVRTQSGNTCEIL